MSSPTTKQSTELVERLIRTNEESQKRHEELLSQVIKNQGTKQSTWPTLNMTYAGNEDPDMIDKFISQLTIIEQQNNWNDETILPFAKTHLTGAALTWYNTTFCDSESGIEQDYNSFVNALNSKFEKKASPAKAFAAIDDLQFHKRNPRGYIQEFRRWASLIPNDIMSETGKILLLMNRTRGVIKSELRYKNPTTLQEAYSVYEITMERIEEVKKDKGLQKHNSFNKFNGSRTKKEDLQSLLSQNTICNILEIYIVSEFEECGSYT